MYLYSWILLPWPQECWDYRYVAQRLALHLSACECACGGRGLLSGTALHSSTFPVAGLFLNADITNPGGPASPRVRLHSEAGAQASPHTALASMLALTQTTDLELQ